MKHTISFREKRGRGGGGVPTKTENLSKNLFINRIIGKNGSEYNFSF